MTRYQRLEAQADHLETVLASHKIHATVEGGTETPRLVRFRLAPAAGVRIAQIARLSEELAMALGARSCRVVRQGDHIQLEFPRQGRSSIRLDTLMAGLPSLPPTTAVLGLDADGAPLLLRLASPDVAHVLIAGTTGSGKTALAQTMIASLIQTQRLSELGVVLIDPKGRGYRPFADAPHLLLPIADHVDAGLAALEWLVGEMERRDYEGVSEPCVVAFIDELADLALVGGKAVEQTLTRIVQRGREAGIHVVACTQKPSASVIGSLVKSNFPVRVVGAVASADDARVATGMAGSGAEQLGGRGDFLVIVHGVAHRLQAAYVPPAELEALVRRVNEGDLRGRSDGAGASSAAWTTGWQSIAERIKRAVSG